MAKARLRPSSWPTFPPVIMKEAMTRVYRVIADWIPVTVVPRSSATVAIDTFMTELSRAMRNCPEASVTRTAPCEAVARADDVDCAGAAAISAPPPPGRVVLRSPSPHRLLLRQPRPPRPVAGRPATDGTGLPTFPDRPVRGLTRGG